MTQWRINITLPDQGLNWLCVCTCVSYSLNTNLRRFLRDSDLGMLIPDPISIFTFINT